MVKKLFVGMQNMDAILSDSPIVSFFFVQISNFSLENILSNIFNLLLSSIQNRTLSSYALLICDDCFCNIIIIHVHCFLIVLTKK